MSGDFYWLNEPQQWRDTQGKIEVLTDGNTDFWRKTWYGFERFSGHGYVRDVTGDFTFQVRIQARFSELYDQAGVLLVADDQNWLKAGIEFNDGAPAIGSVLTQVFSDWATGIFTGDAGDFWLRLSRKGDALRLQYSTDGRVWPLLRLCHFPHPRCAVGVMCCTPERSGLAVSFTEMALTPLLEKELHDLS